MHAWNACQKELSAAWLLITVTKWPASSARLQLLYGLLRRVRNIHQAGNGCLQPTQSHEGMSTQQHTSVRQLQQLAVPWSERQQPCQQIDSLQLQQRQCIHLERYLQHVCCGVSSGHLPSELKLPQQLSFSCTTLVETVSCVTPLFGSTTARTYCSSTAAVSQQQQQRRQKHQWQPKQRMWSSPVGASTPAPAQSTHLKKRTRRHHDDSDMLTDISSHQRQRQQQPLQQRQQQQHPDARQQHQYDMPSMPSDPQHHHHQQQQQHLLLPPCSFTDIGVPQELVDILQTDLNLQHPTPVQVEALTPVMQGRHVAVQSATGTGKTLAYLLPLMSRIRPWELSASHVRHGRVLVICPTQELCMQVVRTARSLCPHDRHSVMPLVGGSNFLKAVKSLTKHKPWLIVATPGRLKDIAEKPNLFKKAFPRVAGQQQQDSDHHTMTVVLEEAPKLLSMTDTQLVLDRLAPQTRQTDASMSVMERLLKHHQVLLVSANLKPGVLSAAHAWVQASPVLITAPPPPHTKMADKDSSNHKQHMAADAHESPSRAGSKGTQLVSDPRPRSTTQLLPDSITHQVMMFDPKKSNLEKLVLRCLQWYKAQGQKVLLFMGDQGKLVQLAERLTAGAGSVKVLCLHGRLPAHTKASYMRQFNHGRCDALLVSDGFALGLDFEGVDVVMQVGSLPASLSQYINRAGRCGRMGRPGQVLSIIPDDRREPFDKLLKRIKITPIEMTIKGKAGKQGPIVAMKQVKPDA